MLQAFLQLMLFQLTGELLAALSGMPFPGAVLGMILLFVWLQFNELSPELRNASDILVSNLGLLFIPAGVAIIQFGSLLAAYGAALLAAVVISVCAAVAITGITASVRPGVRNKVLQRLLTSTGKAAE